MGMSITEEEHERWHREHAEITPEQHKALMKKMGISEKEDKEWHNKHGMFQKTSPKPGLLPVNPFAIGGGFLDYCIRQGWLVREGTVRTAKYYVTKEGIKGLGKFGIKI
jgi:hypothetical protein